MDYRQPIEPIIIVLVTIGLFGIGKTPATQSPIAKNSILLEDTLEAQPEPEAVLA